MIYHNYIDIKISSTKLCHLLFLNNFITLLLFIIFYLLKSPAVFLFKDPNQQQNTMVVVNKVVLHDIDNKGRV